MRSNFLHLASKAPGTLPEADRIYVSREGGRFRRATNEAEMVDRLGSRGFQTVVLDTLTFLDQVRLFRAAWVLVAPPGAGLTNSVFSDPGTKVMKIQPWKLQTPFFRIAEALGLKYSYVRSSTWSGQFGQQPPAPDSGIG